MNAGAVVDYFGPATLSPPFGEVLLFSGCDTVHRVRNPDVWDAMLPPLFAHRRQMSDAARAFRTFCALYGATVITPFGAALLPPRPRTVLTLDDSAFVKIGMRYRAHALRAVAHEYLAQRRHLTPPFTATALFTALLGIPNIGTASAARVVADTTNDLSVHARTGFGSRDRWTQLAAHLDPDTSPNVYQTRWQSLSQEQRSTLIALTFNQYLECAAGTATAGTVGHRATERTRWNTSDRTHPRRHPTADVLPGSSVVRCERPIRVDRNQIVTLDYRWGFAP